MLPISGSVTYFIWQKTEKEKTVPTQVLYSLPLNMPIIVLPVTENSRIGSMVM